MNSLKSFSVFVFVFISTAVFLVTPDEIDPKNKESLFDHLQFLGHAKEEESKNVKSFSNLETLLKESLLSFQKFHGLKQSGILDQATEKLLKTPRCGLPDVRDAKLSQFKSKWKKNDLTFRVLNGFPGLDVNTIMMKAFSHWSKASSLTFRPTTSPNADLNILFGSRHHQDNFPFDGKGGVLAHAFYPEDGKIHFDADEKFTEGRPDGTDLLMVAVHEIGHALGLDHNNYPGSIMNPYYTGFVPNFKLPDIDRREIAYLYGGPRPSATTTKATTRTTQRTTTTTIRKTTPKLTTALSTRATTKVTTKATIKTTPKSTTRTTAKPSTTKFCYNVCSTVCTPIKNNG